MKDRPRSDHSTVPINKIRRNVFDCLYNANFTSEDDARRAKKHKGRKEEKSQKFTSRSLQK